MSVHLVNPSDNSFGTAVITPRWLFVLAEATPESAGTPILVDSYFALERGRDLLWLAGTNDAGTRIPDLNFAIPPNPRAPVILMCHEPDYVETVVQHPRFPLVDLMLSGHSHGGQIRLPILGPLILPPMGQKYVEGMFHFDHMQLYVNRGIGTVGLPFRLNCPAELTHYTLVQAPDSDSNPTLNRTRTTAR